MASRVRMASIAEDPMVIARAAEIVAADHLAGNNIGKRKVRRCGAQLQHGRFSMCHESISSMDSVFGS